MNREMTNREKFLALILAILLICVGYYKLVHEPVTTTIEESERRIANAESALLIEMAKYQQMLDMQAELDALKADGEKANAIVPEYNNMENVMVQLNAILGKNREFKLTFQQVTEEEGLMIRPVSMQFEASDYQDAKEILERLYHCYYRCNLSNITIDTQDADENIAENPVTVTLTVTFLERA